MHTKSLPWRTLFLFLCCLLSLTSCASRRTIVNALDEKEANEILVILEGRGVKASKVKDAGGGGGATKEVLWNIVVSEEQATRAMSILNQLGLPRRRSQNLLGIFKDTGLVPSEMQEQIRYQEGLGESIASSIRKMDGVLDADVRISFPKEDPLNPDAKKKEKIAASVYVKHSGILDDPNSLMVPRIKRLVSGSITGLAYENVTVISDRARYAEASLNRLESGLQAEKEFVSIWSLAIAKESVTRFRIIFFSLILSVLFLLLAMIWVGWKIYPVLRENGGIKALFLLTPLGAAAAVKSEEGEEGDEEDEEEDDEEEEDDDEEEEEEEPGEPADADIDRDFDET